MVDIDKENEIKVLVTQLCTTLLRPQEPQPVGLLCPWDSPGKNNGVGSHFLLQGIFPIQGLNLGLLHCRQILSHQESPDKERGCEKTKCLAPNHTLESWKPRSTWVCLQVSPFTHNYPFLLVLQFMFISKSPLPIAFPISKGINTLDTQGFACLRLNSFCHLVKCRILLILAVGTLTFVFLLLLPLHFSGT